MPAHDRIKRGRHVNASIVQLAKDLIPPALARYGQALLHGWSGNYATWAEAEARSTGYDAAGILEKVKTATLKVKNGEAAYERDSVLFAEPQYSYPLLAAFMWIAAANKGHLRLIDFGGALGSTYHQHRRFLAALPELEWQVVEQKHFVDCGRQHFEDDRLTFHETIADCCRKQRPSAILFSSVLPYLEHPFAPVDEAMAKGIEFILVDLTGFVNRGPDRITVQKVPPSIYPASYPCRFFNRANFLKHFDDRYEVVAEFTDTIGQNIQLGLLTKADYKGFVFRRRAYEPL